MCFFMNNYDFYFLNQLITLMFAYTVTVMCFFFENLRVPTRKLFNN
jgi:hypothetical protein